MLYFSDPSSLEHDPRELMPGHPEAPARLVAIERRLAAEDRLGWERRPAPAASAAELELAHTPRHVAAVRALSEAGGGALDVETYAGPHSYRAAAHAAGGAAAMARALLAGEARAGFSAARPATTPNRSGRWASACSTRSRSRRRWRSPSWAPPGS